MLLFIQAYYMLNSQSLYKSAPYPPSYVFRVEDTSLCRITGMTKWKDIKRFNQSEKQHAQEKKQTQQIKKKRTVIYDLYKIALVF